MSRARAIVDHVRWLEGIGPMRGEDRAIMRARIDHGWINVIRARDEERADIEHDTVPRISMRL